MKKLKPSMVNRNSEARSHWARVLKDFQKALSGAAYCRSEDQSGLSGAAYCRSEDLYYPTFAKWRQKLLGPVRTLGKRKPSPALFSKFELLYFTVFQNPTIPLSWYSLSSKDQKFPIIFSGF
jgi:hypothetical protein